MFETTRLLGALLIAGCGAAIGFSAGSRMRLRVKVIGNLIFSLETMRSEIAYAGTRLPEIIKKLAGCGLSPVCGFFSDISQNLELNPHENFGQLWRASLRRNLPHMALSDEESEVLSDLSLTLGRYDLDGEERALNLAIRRLERCLSIARERRNRDGRLCQTLGIGSGIIAAIILL
jgi:stage III sporulation protein AB